MKNFKEIKATRKNTNYIQMAIEKLVETCDWVNTDDNNIIILSDGVDFVAIPDAYADEGTEFYTTLDTCVILTYDKNCNYIAVVA